jgi:hypothetical protein
VKRRGARESALERWACAKARALKIPTSKLRDPVGVTDRVFWFDGGRPAVVEFKDAHGHTNRDREELQEWWRARFRELGYVVRKVDGKEEFIALLEEMEAV